VLTPRHHILQKGAGFSLLEVLVASLLFSFGLAGFASLLLASIAGASESRQEGAAALAAAALAEQLRMNPTALQPYLDPPETVSRICDGTVECTAD